MKNLRTSFAGLFGSDLKWLYFLCYLYYAFYIVNFIDINISTTPFPVKKKSSQCQIDESQSDFFPLNVENY